MNVNLQIGLQSLDNIFKICHIPSDKCLKINLILIKSFDIPSAQYLTFAQRSLSYETAFLETIGAIEHKDRVAGLISIGGSTRAWQSMVLEGL